MQDLANKLYVLRSQAGLSQSSFAEMLNVSRQTVSKWELGASIPEIAKLIDISNLFGVSTDYLLKNVNGVPVKSSVDRVILQFLGYAQEMESISEQLVSVMRDGVLDAQERQQLKLMVKKLQEVSQVIEDIQLGLRENGIL